MNPPAGTFLAKVRNGAMQIPAPVKAYCDAEGWSLFRFEMMDADHLVMHPVSPSDSPSDSSDAFHASLSTEGLLWIPSDVRKSVALGEQSVMLRIAGGAIHAWLRKVFDTLGFRPR